jgi:predicted dehydrogenase
MASELRVGLIGLDTSHVPAFTKTLNDAKNPEHVAGARVVAGYPGGSKDFDLSISRVDKFTHEIRDGHNVQIMDTPEAVAEACDILFITAVDGRTHLDYVKRTAKYKRPTFIDKPVAVTSTDAKQIYDIAQQGGFPLMSASSLRYADALTTSLAEHPGHIFGCDVYGPMAIQPTQPGWFWYGVHIVEIANRIMGTGCQQVSVVKNDDFDVMTATWADGRIATLRGHRKGHSRFGVAVHREKESQYLDLSSYKRSYYANMLDAILKTLPNGKSDIAPESTLEIVRLIEAANESRETGRPVKL